MPNYEIYPADIMAVLDVLGRTRGPVTVDSTDFQVTLTGTKLEILRGMRPIGHMNVGVSAAVVHLGKLYVEPAYRRSGVSNLLIFIALIDGVRKDALMVALNEDSEVSAYGFWARFGIQVTAGQRTNLVTVLRKFEESQAALAEGLRLQRTPRTMLLNTDYPSATTTMTTTTSASASASRSKSQRRGSFT